MKNANATLGIEFHLLTSEKTEKVTWRIHLSISTIPATNEEFLDCCPNGNLEKNYDFTRLSSAISCGIEICERFGFQIPDSLRYPSRCILNNPVHWGLLIGLTFRLLAKKHSIRFSRLVKKQIKFPLLVDP